MVGRRSGLSIFAEVREREDCLIWYVGLWLAFGFAHEVVDKTSSFLVLYVRIIYVGFRGSRDRKRVASFSFFDLTSRVPLISCIEFPSLVNESS